MNKTLIIDFLSGTFSFAELEISLGWFAHSATLLKITKSTGENNWGLTPRDRSIFANELTTFYL